MPKIPRNRAPMRYGAGYPAPGPGAVFPAPKGVWAPAGAHERGRMARAMGGRRAPSPESYAGAGRRIPDVRKSRIENPDGLGAAATPPRSRRGPGVISDFRPTVGCLKWSFVLVARETSRGGETPAPATDVNA